MQTQLKLAHGEKLRNNLTSLLYSFHPLADEQQTEIWLYTYKQWGIAQADKYIDGLHEQLFKAAQDFSLLKSVSNLSNVKFFHYIRHYVFIKEAETHLPEKIQVLALLHDRMDMPAKLSKILSDL